MSLHSYNLRCWQFHSCLPKYVQFEQIFWPFSQFFNDTWQLFLLASLIPWLSGEILHDLQMMYSNLSHLTPWEQCQTHCSQPNPNPYPLPNHFLIYIIVLPHVLAIGGKRAANHVLLVTVGAYTCSHYQSLFSREPGDEVTLSTRKTSVGGGGWRWGRIS